MKPLIINVRGNSGSGKTHLTREFMKCGEFQEAFRSWFSNNRVQADQIGTLKYTKRPWVVIGSYRNTCGGVDTIRTQNEIVKRVEHYSAQNLNIWLEGLLMSGMYGTVGQYSEAFNDRWIFAFLDTPLDKCLQRVRQRRKEAGNINPFNETNTRVRHTTIERTQQRIEQMGRRVVVLDHTKALEQLLKIIRKEG